MDVERYIETLKREQAELALNALKNPKARDAFELGLIAGLVQGYERTLKLLDDQLAETRGTVRPILQPSRPANPYLEDLDRAPTLPEQMGRGRK